MSIFDRLERRPTGMQKPYGWTTLQVLRKGTGKTRPTIDRCTEYLLQGQIETRFWADSAQLPAAQRDAEKALAFALYEDFLRLIVEARAAAWAGDPTAVLEVLNRMEKEVIGG